MSTFPDKLYEMGGVPVGGARYSGPWATHYFVDGANGSDGNTGRTTTRALKTIQAAVTLAGVGDVIYVRPQAYVVGTGHTRYDEIVTVPLATSDLSLIGVGYPRSNEFGVRIRTSTTGYGLTVAAPSMHVENIGFIVGGTGTGNFIFQNNGATNTQRGSDGFTIYNCNFKGGTDVVRGGQAGRIINSVFMHATGTLTIAVPAVSGYGQQIRNCSFLDNNGAAVTGPYISGSGAHTYNLLIEGCYFQQVPSDSFYVVLGGTLNTGMIANCYFEDDDVHLTNNLTLGGTEMRVIGSYDLTGLIA